MLQQLTGRVYVAVGGTNVGVVLADDDRAVLIDTGPNDGMARKVLRAVREDLGTEVRAILTTHGHADHFGAHRFIVTRTNARVYAPDIDEMVLRHPLMQTVLLFGGADPADTLRTRFLLAEDCPVNSVLEPGRQLLEGVDIDVVSLAGHSMNQMGFVVDGIFFCADVVFPDTTLEKYRIPYLFGLTEHLDALEYSLSIACQRVVPGHGPVGEAISGPVARDREVIDRTIAALLSVLDTPKSADEISTDLFTALDVPVGDDGGYFLLRSTIAAYLSHLHRVGEIGTEIANKGVVWRKL